MVSVVIPVKNGEETLGNAVESAIGQTLQPVEIIIVDDGSEDQTLRVAKYFENQHPEIVRVVMNRGRGVSEARNYGVQLANSELIAFLDADDSWLPKKLEKQTKSELSSQHLISLTSALYINESGSRVGVSLRLQTARQLAFETYSNLYMPSVLSSWVMSKNTFNFVGGFDKRYTYAQDYEFFFRALKKGVDICIVNEEMTCYRINVNGVSTLRHREQKYFAMHAQLSDNEKKEDPGIFVQRMLKKNVFSMRRTLASECIRKSLTIDKKRLGWLLSRTALLIVALILDPFEFKKKLKRHSIIFLNSSVNSINSKKL